MRASVMILAVVVGLVIQSCSTTPARNLDAHALWRSAESRHSAAVRDVAERQRLQNDYATIIRLSRDGDLRGRAFVRLAELDVALGEYEHARRNLEQSLRADMSPAHRRSALLMLGDLMERRLNSEPDAVSAYRQIISEYPDSPETELARLRLRLMKDEL